jgi:hypothetical protein
MSFVGVMGRTLDCNSQCVGPNGPKHGDPKKKASATKAPFLSSVVGSGARTAKRGVARDGHLLLGSSGLPGHQPQPSATGFYHCEIRVNSAETIRQTVGDRNTSDLEDLAQAMDFDEQDGRRDLRARS